MKNNRLFRQTATMLLALAMVFTMMPVLGAQDAYAETAEADGGTVASNSKSDAEEAFGASNVTAEYSSKKLTIELKNDISLRSPVRFVKGNAGDKIILDLKGHTITGKAGVPGTDNDASQGGNAIEIAASDFDVEINGPGSVTGGKGSVYQQDNNYRYGRKGGNAVFFINDETNSSYKPQKLEHGLKVTGGAVIKGGAGSDITFDDWANNIAVHSVDDTTRVCLEAGKGGDGVSQEFTDSDKSVAVDEQTFANINIENGSAVGGAGGNVTIGDSHPMTNTYITGIQAVKNLMSSNRDYAKGYYDGWFFSRIRFIQGNGGNGIRFAAGRKYISVGKDGSVIGGKGGRIDYGNNAKFVNRVKNNWVSGSWNSETSYYNVGAGGDAISCWGDIGLTNTSPALSNISGNANYWDTKASDADDIGIYVAGTVRGGDSSSTDAANDYAREAGAGIKVNPNQYAYCESTDYSLWNGEIGIVFVDSTGIVEGGKGGSAVDGEAGEGGDGIFENASSMYIEGAANHYIVRGSVIGGKGGDSGNSSYGYGGNAIDFRKDKGQRKIIAGNGTLKAGDCGSEQFSSTWAAGTVDSSNRILDANGEPVFEPAVDGLDDGSIDFYGSVNRTDGGYAYARKDSLNGFKASVTMTPLDSKPKTSTVLSCSIKKPSGYSGNAYYKWHATVNGYTYTGGGDILFDIEGAGTNIQRFNLLSNSDYHNVEMMTSYGSPTYYIKTVTADTLMEHARYNDTAKVTIWCDVMLEDGRTVKSNEIWFTKNYRSSNGETYPAEETAVDKVKKLISALPEDTDLKLSDESAVVNARTAFDKLSEEEQTQVGGELRAKLENDEARLVVLKEADAVSTLIANLSGPDELEIGDEEAVNAAREAYDSLSAQAKALITKAELNKLETAEAVVEAKKQEAEDMIAASAVAERIGEIVIPEDFDSLEADSDDFQELKQAVSDASDAYNALSDEQKALIDDESFSALADAVGQLNGKLEEEERIAEPVAPQFTTITENMITVGEAVYTGKALEPDVTVVCDGRTLIRSVDYEVAGYGNNVNAGKATVTVTGRKLYKGTVKKTFTISRKKVTPNVTLSPASSVWDNKTHKPKITVKSGATVLKEKRDYTTNVKKYRSIGNYSIKVTLTGNYSGSKTVTYKIVPKGTSIAGLSGSKKALTVRWRRQAARMPKARVTGYQVQYSLKKDFKSAKAVTVKGYKATAKKITRLNAKKLYYVRVRTYMKTGGKTYYSSWSKVKAARTK